MGGAGWQRAGAVLLGRRSFEGYEAVRSSHPTSPVLAFLDSVPTHVVTSSALQAPRPDVHVVTGDVEGGISALRERAEGTVLVLGSPTLSRWLIAHHLLDSIDLVVLPVIVGPGVRLFAEAEAEADPGRAGLLLRQARALGSGAVQLSYDVVPEGSGRS